MASVGSAYVTIKVNTRGFQGQLNKLMAGLTKDMRRHGREMGKELIAGMQENDPSKFFNDLGMSAQRAATKAVNSFERVDTGLEAVGNRSKQTADKVDTSMGRVSASVLRTANDVRSTGDAFRDINRGANGLDRVARSARGAGFNLRAAGDGAGFFRKQLFDILSGGEEVRAALERMYTVAAFGGTALAGLVGGASAAAQGIFVVASQAVAAAPALSALANAGIGLVQVFGAIGISSKGVGEAIGAGFEGAALKATSGAAKTEGATRAMLAAIRNAQRGVRDAMRGVADAQQGLRDAHREAAQAAEDAARRVRAAEASVAASHRAVAAAQRELNLARKEGKELLEDIAFAAEDAALQEERAALNLEDAALALQEAQSLPPDDRGRREAELAFKEAELAMRMAKDRRQDADKEQQHAAKTGVAGLESVQAAQENLRDAQIAARAAQQDLTDARREENEVLAENARKIADARQAIVDAKQDLSDANARLRDARAAAREGAQGLTDYGTAVNKYQEALKKLSPAQQEFVKTLVAMRPELMRARNTIAQPMFEHLTDALINIRDGKFFDIVVEGLAGTANQLGIVAERTSRTVNEGVFSSRFAGVMATNNKAIGIFGGTFDNLLRLFVNVASAARPLVVTFARWTRRVTEGWLATRNSNDEIRAMSERFKTAARRGVELFKFLGALWGVTKTLGRAAVTAGDNFAWMNDAGKAKKGYIPSLTASLNDFDKKLNKPRNFNRLVSGFDQALKNMNAIGRALKNAVIDPLVGMGQDPAIEKAFDKLGKTDAFDRLGATASDALPALTELVVQVSEILATMSESGSMKIFMTILAKAAGAARRFVDALAGISLSDLVPDHVAEAIRNVARSFERLTGIDLGGLIPDWMRNGGDKSLLAIAGGALAIWKAFKLLSRIGKGLLAALIPKGIANKIGLRLAGGIKPAQRAGNATGNAFGAGMNRALTGQTKAIQATMIKLMSSIRLKYVPYSKATGDRIGKAMGQGFRNGLNKQIPLIRASASNAGNQALIAMKRALGVKSPSTKGMYVGTQLVAGFTAGVKTATGPAAVQAGASGRAVGQAFGKGAVGSVAASSAAVAGATAPANVAMKTTGITARVSSVGVRALGGAFRFAMGPLMTIMLVFELILPLLKKLYKENETFRKIVDTVWGAIKDAMKAVVRALGSVWKAAKDAFDWIKKHWRLIAAILLGPFGIAVGLITKHWDKIVAGAKAVWGWIRDNWKAVLGWIVNPIGSAYKLVKNNWDKIVDGAKWVVGKVKGFFSGIGEFIGNVFRRAGDYAKAGINVLIDFLNRNLVGKINKVTGKFGLTIPNIPRLADGGRAGEGRVSGPGGRRQDNHLTLLSTDEQVIPARIGNKYGHAFWDTLRRTGQIPPHGGALDYVKGSFNAAKKFGGATISGIGNIGEAIAKKGLGKVLETIVNGVKKLMGTAGLNRGNFFNDFLYGVLDRLEGVAKDWGGDKGAEGGGPGLATFASKSAYRGPGGSSWSYPLTRRYPGYNYPGHKPSGAFDIAAPIGTGVRSVGPGVLRGNYNMGRAGYGRYSIVDHPGGYSTLYAHLSAVTRAAGSIVRAGEVIARTGRSGAVRGANRGAHLHLEALGGGDQDTLKLLRKLGVKLATGGVVKSTQGGVLSVIAEAGQHERVEPLDSDGMSKRDRVMLDLIRDLIQSRQGGDEWHIHPSPGMTQAEFAKQVRREVTFTRRRGA